MRGHTLRKLSIAGLLAWTFGVTTPAAAETAAQRCRRTLDRMVSAQSSRLLKELKRCSRRHDDPVSFATGCTPFVGEDDNLHAAEKRMNSGLERVERHGDDKFPRKCDGAPPDMFEPACFDIVDSEVQLRRCIYNDHTLDILVDLVAITAALPQACRTQTLEMARMGWRDWIKEDRDRILDRAQRRMQRHCGEATAHWDLIVDAIFDRSLMLRQMVPAD